MSTPMPRPAPVMSQTFLSVICSVLSVFLFRASWVQQHLDRAPFVHCLVAGGCFVERQLEVEDLSWVDRPVPDQVDQLGQEPAHRSGAAVKARLQNMSMPGTATS